MQLSRGEKAMTTGRRELTWMACDALAAAGRKPSIASVREWTLANQGRKQGSDTDTQADINAWYAVLLSMKQERQTIAGLPDDVAALARGFWIRANEAASGNLAAQREAMEAGLREAQQHVAAAQAETDAAQRLVERTTHEREVAHEAIRRLEETLSAVRASAEAAEVRHAGQLQARDERLAALRQDSARKESEQAARLVELDGLRRHAMQQIEEARADTRLAKAENERQQHQQQALLAAERQAAASARTELASVAGRLSAVEESLAAEQRRSAALEDALAQARSMERSNERSGRAAPATARARQLRVARAQPFRRRKL
jgi:chromosome segregation ATPase